MPVGSPLATVPRAAEAYRVRPRSIKDIDSLISSRRRELEELRYYNRHLLSRSLLQRASSMGVRWEDDPLGGELEAAVEATPGSPEEARFERQAMSEKRLTQRWVSGTPPKAHSATADRSVRPTLTPPRRTRDPAAPSTPLSRAAASPIQSRSAKVSGVEARWQALTGSATPESDVSQRDESPARSTGATETARALFPNPQPVPQRGRPATSLPQKTALSTRETKTLSTVLQATTSVTALQLKASETQKTRELEAAQRKLAETERTMRELREEWDSATKEAKAEKKKAKAAAAELDALKAGVADERDGRREQHVLEHQQWEQKLIEAEAAAAEAEEEALQVAELAKIQAQELEEDAKMWEQEATRSRTELAALVTELEHTKVRFDEERRAAAATVARWQEYSKGLQDQTRAVVLRHLGSAAATGARRRTFNIWRAQTVGAPVLGANALVPSGLAPLREVREDGADDAEDMAVVPTTDKAEASEAWLMEEHAALRHELDRMRRADATRRSMGAGKLLALPPPAVAKQGLTASGFFRAVMWILLGLALVMFWGQQRTVPRIAF